MKRIVGFILLTALLEACNLNFGGEGGKETYNYPQTRILRIDLTPDTVATGDTVLIHCVIKDSLDLRFKYYWGLGKDTLAVNGTVTGPYIKFITPTFNTEPKDTVILVGGIVSVDNGGTDSLGVGAEFNIPVIKK